MDILFVIDATGSMASSLKAAHDKASQIAVGLRVDNTDVNFRFGAVCYRDPIDSKNDKHEYIDFVEDIDDLVSFLQNIKADGGGDAPEDVAGAFDIALHKLSWRDGPKSIIFIADAPAHGSRYCGQTSHQEQEALLPPLLHEISERKILFTGIDINGGCAQCLEEMKKDYTGPKFTTETLNIRGSYGEAYSCAMPMMCCASACADMLCDEAPTSFCKSACPSLGAAPSMAGEDASVEIGNILEKATKDSAAEALSLFYV